MDPRQQGRYNLDADIMQCKADIQKALVSAAPVPQPARSAPAPQNIPKAAAIIPAAPPESGTAAPLKPPSNNDSVLREISQLHAQLELMASELDIHKKAATDDRDRLAGAILSLNQTGRDIAGLKDAVQKANQDHIGELRQELRQLRDGLSQTREAERKRIENIAERQDEIAKKISDLEEQNPQTAALEAAVQHHDRQINLLSEQFRSTAEELSGRLSRVRAETEERLCAAIADMQKTSQAGSIEQKIDSAIERLTKASATTEGLRDEFQSGFAQNNRRLEDLEDRLGRLADASTSQPQTGAFVPPPQQVIPDLPQLSDDDIPQVNIPQFNLAEQMMADRRRRTSAVRKAPSQKISSDRYDHVRNVVSQYIHPAAAPQKTPQQQIPASPPVWMTALPTDPNDERLLAQIVNRDIGRFLSPQQSRAAFIQTFN